MQRIFENERRETVLLPTNPSLRDGSYFPSGGVAGTLCGACHPLVEPLWRRPLLTAGKIGSRRRGNLIVYRP